MAEYVDVVTKKRVDLDEDFGCFIYEINFKVLILIKQIKKYL